MDSAMKITMTITNAGSGSKPLSCNIEAQGPDGQAYELTPNDSVALIHARKSWPKRTQQRVSRGLGSALSGAVRISRKHPTAAVTTVAGLIAVGGFAMMLRRWVSNELDLSEVDLGGETW